MKKELSVGVYTLVTDGVDGLPRIRETGSYEKHDVIPERALAAPEKIAEALNELFGTEAKAEEAVYMVVFGQAFRPVGIFSAGSGDLGTVPGNTQGLLIRALLCGGKYAAVIHNHPSGYTLPSRADRKTLEKMSEAFRIVGIELSDFIIVGKNNLYSEAISGDGSIIKKLVPESEAGLLYGYR